MSELIQQHGFTRWSISLVDVVFGLLTIKESGGVLSGDSAYRLEAGDYVPFVVWFNFIAGFSYVIAGIGLWRERNLAV